MFGPPVRYYLFWKYRFGGITATRGVPCFFSFYKCKHIFCRFDARHVVRNSSLPSSEMTLLRSLNTCEKVPHAVAFYTLFVCERMLILCKTWQSCFEKLACKLRVASTAKHRARAPTSLIMLSLKSNSISEAVILRSKAIASATAPVSPIALDASRRRLSLSPLFGAVSTRANAFMA